MLRVCILPLCALAIAFSARPTAAQGLADPPKPPDDIRKQVDDLNRALADLDKQLEKIATTLIGLRSQLAALRTQTGETQRFYQPPPATPTTGRLRLVNSHTVPVLFMINNMPYELAPGNEVVLNQVPAGSFTYDVDGISPPVRRTSVLAAGDTKTLEVHP